MRITRRRSSCTNAGQAVFVIDMEFKLFWLVLFDRVFFGMGEGFTDMGVRVSIVYWFHNRELTFAMGVVVVVTNVSEMLAKATVAPVALHFGGYVQALWCGTSICLVSVVVIVCRYTTLLKRVVKERVKSDEPQDPELYCLNVYADQKRRKKIAKTYLHHVGETKEVSRESVQQFSRNFWTIATLHVVFINVFHFLQSVNSSFLYQRYGYLIVKSGIMSSIPRSCLVFASFIGFFIDQFGGRMFLPIWNVFGKFIAC